MARLSMLLAALVAVGPVAPPIASIRAALVQAHAIPADPRLATIRTRCAIAADGRRFTAVDVVERVTRAQSDMLYRRVFILDDRLRATAALPYYLPARLRSCRDDRLVFSAPVTIDNTLPEGRVVRVSDDGRTMTVVR